MWCPERESYGFLFFCLSYTVHRVIYSIYQWEWHFKNIVKNNISVYISDYSGTDSNDKDSGNYNP